MKKKLDWKNLKDEYCPSCYRELVDSGIEWKCTACKFRITKARYQEILEDMNKEEQAHESFDENLESWD